eukprot:scaffold294022_cov43-Prasinocladus_malaysianus.AAC.1
MPMNTIRLMTNHLPCGSEVKIDFDEDTPVIEVKRRLEAATGIPVEHQKLMLANLTEPMLGDKRLPMSFGSVGHCSHGMGLA